MMNIKRPEPWQPIPKDAKLVFEGETLRIYQWEQELFDGSYKTYESSRRADSVTVIPVTKEKEILVLDQIQAGFKEWFLSLPGGQIDKGEAPETAARRELLEETGYSCQSLSLWDSRQPFSRMDWAVYTFVAHGCEEVAQMELDRGEKMRLSKVNFEEFLDLVEEENFRHVDISLQILKMKLHKGKIDELRKDLRL